MEIVSVTKENYEHYKDAYIKLYQDIFSKAPYFEIFTREEVERVYRLSLLNATISLLAIENDQLIGFALGIQLSMHNDKNFKTLVDKYFELERVLYNAELGVHSQYRGLGIGSRLINKRVAFAKEKGYRAICMRTKKEGSMSVSLYKRLGFELLEGVEELSTTEKSMLLEKEDIRVVFYRYI